MGKTIFKRLTALALTAGLCLSFAGAVTFTDVSPASWYYNAVDTSSNAGYLNGYPDGTFRPNAAMTRAECAQMLKNVSSHWDAEVYYSDVDSSAWYADVVSHYGPYMGGSYTDYSQTTPLGYAAYFYPNRACTREDFAYGFGLVIGIPTSNPGFGFDDWASINPEYVDVIGSLKTYGIINGDGQGRYGNFNPKSTITRAEVAQILTNYLEFYV